MFIKLNRFKTIVNKALAAFSPASLFASGEQGVWYDPSDFTTMFEDSTGTIPITTVEKPVGRILDKSGRGNHALQATTTKRPVLSARYNQLVGTTTLATQNVTTLATDYILSFTGAGSITLSGTKIQAGITAGTNTITGVTAGTLTLTVTGTVTNAQLVPLSQSTIPYQQVTTSTDYDTDSTNFPPYLSFDGVDDALATTNIDFSTTNKVSIFTGLRKNNTVLSLLCELTTSSGLNNNVFGVFAPRAISTGGDYALTTKGSLGGQAITPNSYPSPITNTLAAFGDIPGDTGNININGVLVASGVFDQGTGNYSNAPLFIGARNQTSLYFSGNIFSLIVRGAESTATQITDTETYVNSKTKAY